MLDTIIMEQIEEILVTYEDGGKVLYRGKGINRFIKSVSSPIQPQLSQPQLSQFQQPQEESSAVEAARGYKSANITYSVARENPIQAAQRMKKEAEARGMTFQ